MKRRLRTVSGRNRRRLIAEPLEARRVLAASFGWDGPGLGSAELTYTVGNAPSSLSQAEVDRAIETAFNAWASVVDITFTEINQTGLRDSIDITFKNIDGRGGILAQAYFPDDVNRARIAGDIEFDLAESWEVGNSQGNRAFDLAWVATHEIGHSLGLDHSRDPGAVLAAYVSPNQQFVALDNDDVSEIRQLYAASSGTVTTNTPASPTPSEVPAVNEPSDPVAPNQPTNPSDNDSGDTDNDSFRRWRWWWRWRAFWRGWGGRATADDPATSVPESTTDANHDGSTSAVDALAIINHLNRNAAVGAGFYDVNGDGTISAADALMVINSLGRGETTLAGEEAANHDADETGGDESDHQSDAGDPVDDGGSPTENEDVDSPMDDDKIDGRHHRFGGRHLLRGNHDRLFTRFDANENDALSEEELPTRLWQRLVDKSIDADGDDSITRQELEDYAADRRAERFAKKDSDDSGSLTLDELSPRFWEKVVAADRNEDGAVTLEELETWLAERKTEVPEGENAEAGELVDEAFDDDDLDEDQVDEQGPDEDEVELDEGDELDEDDCDDDEMDDDEMDDDSESEGLSMAQRRSDRLFAQFGRPLGRR